MSRLTPEESAVIQAAQDLRVNDLDTTGEYAARVVYAVEALNASRREVTPEALVAQARALGVRAGTELGGLLGLARGYAGWPRYQTVEAFAAEDWRNLVDLRNVGWTTLAIWARALAELGVPCAWADALVGHPRFDAAVVDVKAR